MKIRTLGLIAAFSVLAVGQSNSKLTMRSPLGPTTLSATNIYLVGLEPLKLLLHQAYDKQPDTDVVIRRGGKNVTIKDGFKLSPGFSHPIGYRTSAPVTTDTGSGEKKSVHLSGNVQIATNTSILTADEAYFDPNTGEVRAKGNVSIKPIQ